MPHRALSGKCRGPVDPHSYTDTRLSPSQRLDNAEERHEELTQKGRRLTKAERAEYVRLTRILVRAGSIRAPKRNRKRSRKPAVIRVGESLGTTFR